MRLGIWMGLTTIGAALLSTSGMALPLALIYSAMVSAIIVNADRASFLPVGGGWGGFRRGGYFGGYGFSRGLGPHPYPRFGHGHGRAPDVFVGQHSQPAQPRANANDVFVGQHTRKAQGGLFNMFSSSARPSAPTMTSPRAGDLCVATKMVHK